GEAAAERQLLAEATLPLPLVRLGDEAGLTAFDRSALLIAAAPQVATAYGRLYGYVLDDLTRLAPSVELILRLTHDGSVAAAARRRRLGPGGALRRLGLIEASDSLACELTTALRPAPGLVEWLLGAAPAPPVPLADPRLLRPPTAAPPLDPQLLPAARCLREAPNAVVGLWGADPGRHDDAVVALAAACGCAIYRSLARADEGDWAARLRGEAIAASGCDALLWIETRRLLGSTAQAEAAAQLLTRLPQRILLSGRSPWRPIDLVGARPYADIRLARPADDAGQWSAAIGALAPARAQPLAERYRFGWRERQAALRIAAADVRNRTNGAAPDFVEALDRACRLVAAPRSGPSVIVHEPRRTLRDLVLPADLYDQIAEIGPLVAHAGRVDTAWGFGRLLGGDGSIKALFSGDPGTGKTLAAEVIAERAGLQLLKVDLSQVTSKWVGETEKNLDEVFDHAEQSHAVLFFDEADALFGKRGEVRHGVDRYANLEVSYLLQRLETFSGRLVILASNLREEIDPAFIRRFQLALHFPRPAKAERLRLWQLAFAAAPVEAGIALEEFADLDLTGGAITVAARMAALLAAAEPSPEIRRDHIVSAIERQYRKEARLMAGGRGLDGLSVARARC
ncbi:MAG TPA: ATP-binding protein, partial [Allosphingosinicella sp.]|nr:ATP-binding protein [Allosphingosinicella sp.]